MNTDTVIEHYTRKNRLHEIEQALLKKGKTLDNISIDDLGAFDEFHIGGRDATDYFVTKLPFESGMKIVDIGSGIGGPARVIASHFDCHVTGVDLTPHFTDVSIELSQKTKLSDSTDFVTADACDTPFKDMQFDGATLLHASMNIIDKGALYGEISRTLKTGGIFAMYDIFALTTEPQLHFPVPWANDDGTNFLMTVDGLREVLDNNGLDIFYTESRQDYARDALQTLLDEFSDTLDPNYVQRIQNLIMNLDENLCGPWIVLARKL